MNSTTFISCYFLLFLFVYSTNGQAPTCPNGQQPKLDSELRPLQCLPGTSQHSICGPNHNCFFTGLNYMCCPSNEPTIDNQPSCPYPKLTVLDHHGLPMKCSQIARSCPGENMHCSDVGLGYICCETPSFQRGHAAALPTTTTAPIRTSKTTVLPEEELECPGNSIGMLKGDGSRVVCNSRNPCPGTDTFCFGEYKRSICCQKYLYAKSFLDSSSSEETIEKRPPLTPKSIRMSMRKPAAAQGKVHDGELARPTIATTTTTTTIAPTTTTTATRRPKFSITTPSRNYVGFDDESFPQIAINSVGVRRSGPIASSSVFVQKPSEQGKSSGHVRVEIPKPKTSFTFITPPTTTQTVPAAVTRRSNLNGISSINGNDGFKQGRLNIQQNNGVNRQNKQEIAQRLLSYQIRNGWPYDERFYRPDTDVYTEEQRSEIARMRFLPQ